MLFFPVALSFCSIYEGYFYSCAALHFILGRARRQVVVGRFLRGPCSTCPSAGPFFCASACWDIVGGAKRGFDPARLAAQLRCWLAVRVNSNRTGQLWLLYRRVGDSYRGGPQLLNFRSPLQLVYSSIFDNLRRDWESRGPSHVSPGHRQMRCDWLWCIYGLS